MKLRFTEILGAPGSSPFHRRRGEVGCWLLYRTSLHGNSKAFNLRRRIHPLIKHFLGSQKPPRSGEGERGGGGAARKKRKKEREKEGGDRRRMGVGE